MQNKFKSPIKKAQAGMGSVAMQKLSNLGDNLEKANPRIEQIKRQKAMLLPNISGLPTDFKGVLSSRPADENVKPIVVPSEVDKYKESLAKGKEGAFDYYQHYMTKGNGDEAAGALIGNWWKKRKERKQLEKLAAMDADAKALAEKRATMQSAVNKGLNVKRQGDADLITKEFRDKNNKIREVIIGDMNKPATQNAVNKLDGKGNVPGTNVTPAQTIASKTSSAYSPYSIKGDKTYEYAKDSNGEWVTRKRGSKDGAYVTLRDNKDAISKLNSEGVEGDLYPGYIPGSTGGKFTKPKSVTSKTDVSAEDTPEKVKAAFNKYTPESLLKTQYPGSVPKVINTGYKKTYAPGEKIPWNETANRSNDYRGMGTTDPSKYTQAQKEQYADWAITGATTIGGGAVVGGAAKLGSAAIRGGANMIKAGAKAVPNAVAKTSAQIGKGSKAVKEAVKVGSKPNPYERVIENTVEGRYNKAGKLMDPASKRFAGPQAAQVDTRGTIQKALQDKSLTSSFKNVISNAYNKGAKLTKDAYNKLSLKEKQTYDTVIRDMVKKKQAGGFTMRDQLFNHYYNNM